MLLLRIQKVTSRCSSGVEQLIRNEQVVGSNPTSGSMIKYSSQVVSGGCSLYHGGQ